MTDKEIREAIQEATDEQLLNECDFRDVFPEEEETCPEDFSDSELSDVLENRGYRVLEDEDNFFMLKKFFLGYELRNHLLKITGQGSWVSNDELFKELENLMQ